MKKTKAIKELIQSSMREFASTRTLALCGIMGQRLVTTEKSFAEAGGRWGADGNSKAETTPFVTL